MYKFATTILVLSSFTIFAQSFTPSSEQTGLVKKGGKDFEDHKWLTAIKSYEKAIDLNAGTTSLDGATMAEATFRIAKSYENLGDRKKTAIWYEKAKAFNPQNKELVFTYARSLQAANRDADAIKAYEEYIQKGGDGSKARPFLEIINKRVIGTFGLKGAELKALKLREGLSCFAPSFLGNSLVFTSPANKEPSPEKHSCGKAYRYNIYQAKQKMNGDFASPEGFCTCINTKKFNEGPASFNKENSVIFFTRQTVEKNKDGKKVKRSAIYQINLACDKNAAPKLLPFSTGESNYAYAAFNQTGSILYFASDMPGGQGGWDLYKVSVTDTTFGKPENLGNIINTPNDETAPFVAADGKFFFASNGHPGIGGLDIFTADTDPSGKFIRINNLKEPVNSPAEDFGFAIHPQLGTYFASNRNGEFDIFKINTSNFASQNWEFKIVDAATNSPIADAKVDLFSTASKKGEIALTATDGKAIFENALPGNYTLIVEKIGYSKVTQTIDGVAGKAVIQEIKLNTEKGLKGVVTNATDKSPIANAELIWLNDGGKAGIAAISESNGQYTFEKNGAANGSILTVAKGFKESLIGHKELSGRNGAVELTPEVIQQAAPAKDVDLSPFTFAPGKYTLSKTEAARTKTLGQYLKSNSKTKIELTGCTDDTGDDKLNTEIAKKRAEHLEKALVTNGAVKENIAIKTSIKLPIDENCKGKKACIEKSRKANRKVELKIVQ
jgi:outer membrane protein OmpA-like peptidoglycan-associated protein/tetratricopeptide (TPR) repeat protein